MKLIILILAMATKAIAYEQIYAINAGGYAITDSDGIEYKEGVSKNYSFPWKKPLDLIKIAESDRDIYKMVDRLPSRQSVTKLEYNMPLKSDGFYALIAKFSFNHQPNRCYQNMTLNDKIQLLPSFDVYELCGGSGKIRDVYMYFCVSNNELYFEKQTTTIVNEKISIEVNREKGFATIAALVLLKGTLEERHTLKNSITDETLFFDPSKRHSSCSISSSTTVTTPPKTPPKTPPSTIPSPENKSPIDKFCVAKIDSEHRERDIYSKIEALQVDQASLKLEITNLKTDLNAITKTLDAISTSMMIKPR
jgi:Malectin domain